jgi:hypothetical protein
MIRLYLKSSKTENLKLAEAPQVEERLGVIQYDIGEFSINPIKEFWHSVNFLFWKDRKTVFLFMLLCCLSSSLCQADWTNPNPISTTYSFTYRGVYNSCNPTTGEFLAAWADGNDNQYPTYSFFKPNAGWSPIDTITTSSTAVLTSNIYTSCDPITGKFIATWTDISTARPIVSLYTPAVGWSSIDPLTSSTAGINTINCFDSTSGKFLVTWADTSNSNFPTYAFYTPGVGWSPEATISTTSRAANIYTTSDSSTSSVLAVWVDIGTGLPMYSLYTSGAWGSANPISTSASVQNDVMCSFNPLTGKFIAAWSDINLNFYPFYSIYTVGSGWSEKATITTNSGAIDNVALSCDTLTGQFLASWSNISTGSPTYSFYSSTESWSTPQLISGESASRSDIFTCYNPMSGEFLATWGDTSNDDIIFNPTYSFFLNPIPPPSRFAGTIVRNRFLAQTDIIHKLVWVPPADQASVVSYQISRNGNVIAIIPASGPFVYYDHNRSAKQIDVYTIVSLGSNRDQSISLTVSL